MDKFQFRLFVSIFGLVGLTFLIVAFSAARSELAFRSGTITAPGIVVDLEPSRGSKGGTLYMPVFEFTDREDRVHRIIGSVASSPPSYSQGEAVTVLYRPENPDKAQLDSFMEAWFLPLIFGALGTVFASIACGCLIYAARTRARRL